MPQFNPAAALLVLALAALPAAVRAQEAELGQQTVAAMAKLWGAHPGTRANHAKGIVAEGSFTPSRQAARLSKAVLFAGPAVPVTVRFSDSTGLPTLPDGDPGANPHGMSVKFRLPGGGEVDIVDNSLGFFPVATGEEFRDLLQAIAASGPGAAKPTALDRFMAAHPAAPRAFATVATPTSFARETYNGVNAFVFVDAAGKRRPFRFQIQPVAGPAHMTPGEAARQKPDFLMDELTARLARQKVSFRLTAQLAAAGDPVDDATRPWPASRRRVELGTITLTRLVTDKAALASLGFLPENLTPGIEPSGDPLIKARTAAYVVSYGQRTK